MLNEVKHTETHESRYTDLLKERISRLDQVAKLIDGLLDDGGSLREVAEALEQHDNCRAVLSESEHELADALEATRDQDSTPLPVVLSDIEIGIDACTTRLYKVWIILESFHAAPFDFLPRIPEAAFLIRDMQEGATARLAVLNGDAEAEE